MKKILQSKKIKNVTSYKHILVLNMRRLGKSNKETSATTGYNVQYITDLVRLYVNEGMTKVIGNHYSSHNRRMNFEQEKEFLEQFRDEAESGLIVAVQKILEKYEKITGKASNTSTMYKLLKRHGRRKVKPRPHHPGGATEEEKNSSKKLTHCGNKSYWINI